MVQILEFDREPCHRFPFLNAGKGPGAFFRDEVPLHLGVVDRLPAGLQALVATADLQGRELLSNRGSGSPRLLGETLPALLVEELLRRTGVTEPRRVGVLLAGDFYAVPNLDKRGGEGDVTPVWDAFADEFAWVAGVAGNHDLFRDGAHRPRRVGSRQHYLDGAVARPESLNIAGLGGIVGNPRKPQRRTEEDYLGALSQLLELSPDILICHDGPDGTAREQRGMTTARELIELVRPMLVVRGHSHWSDPLAELVNGSQVLNVDARVVVLVAGSEE